MGNHDPAVLLQRRARQQALRIGFLFAPFLSSLRLLFLSVNLGMGADLMLHLHILQNLYDLSDEATAAEVIDSRAFSEFCGVESSNQVPDGDTIGRFRNILVKHGLQEPRLFGVLRRGIQ